MASTRRPSSLGLGMTESSSSSSSRRSILKKDAFIDVHEDLDRAMAAISSETPEQFFRRVFATRSMSPLDLCDAFCFGDARRHRHVALKHVCEVLFELEAPGGDPMSDAMEEFLYGFAFDGGDGEIVVDIKEALRTLDIWKTAAPSSPSHNQAGSPHAHAKGAAVSPAKAAVLEVKAEKLKKVIDSLQQENLRLSRALLSASAAPQDDVAVGETRPPSPLRIAVKKPTGDPGASSSSSKPSPSSQPPTSPAPKVVSRHERELIALANRLEYDGVKKLEELLRRQDEGAGATTAKVSAGFVSLKQLCWLLANECRVGDDLSEAALMELCLGMNFNAQGQLDHREFVRVLLDILVYESRPSRLGAAASNNGDRPRLSEADAALLQRTREYLRGFYGSRDKTRELLDVLCDKYDLEGNRSLALAEMVRVLQRDLAAQHPVQLKLPLTQSETRRLLLQLAEGSPPSHRPQSSPNDDADVFVYYPAILDALFHADTAAASSDNASSAKSRALLSRVLAPEFWAALRSALCPRDDNPALERKIHAQLCKILTKLDPRRSFRVAQRHFARVFNQHWSARDLELLAEALSHALDGRSIQARNDSDQISVRYDVLMRLLFGAPELRDGAALAAIVKALRRNSTHWESELMELVHASGGHHQHKSKKLTYFQVYELLCGHAPSPPVNVTQFLYFVAHLQDDSHIGSHRVDVHALWTLLHDETKTGSPLKKREARSAPNRSGDGADDHAIALLRRCLRVLCGEHALEKALTRLCRHERGVVRVDELANALRGQLRVLRLSPQEQNELGDGEHDAVAAFLDLLTQGTEDDASVSPGGELLYTHVLLDAVFDWDALTEALRLPDRLVDVKKTLELFDWQRDGAIDADDWHKAWRQLTVRTSRSSDKPSTTTPPLQDWAMRVLAQKFPAAASDKRRSSPPGGVGAIDYSRLLVFLLERQQRTALTQLQAAVMLLLQQTCERVTQGARHATTFHLERAFEAIDRDDKGYFHLGDLRTFVLEQLNQMRDNGMDVATLQAYASQGPALEAVMAALVGDKPPRGHTKKQVVSLMRFQELMNHRFALHGAKGSSSARHSSRHKSHKSQHASEDGDDTSSAEEESAESDGVHRGRGRGRSSPPSSSSSSARQVPLEGQITLLRDLEMCIFEISKPFVDAHGQISPAAAYAHLNGVDGTKPKSSPSRRPRSQSPVRSSLRSSSSDSLSASYNGTYSSRRASCSTPTPRTIAESAGVEPLTATRLKQALRRTHGIETSTYLIGQFFLRLGASTKHFLELAKFAAWLAPLSGALPARVKQVVREMLVQSKSGGGHVDLERFVGAVQRKLADAQANEDAIASASHRYAHNSSRREYFEEALPPQFVRPSILLARLHQLNVSLRKPEMTQLLRHFGMEGQLEIDYALFLRRLHELTQQLPIHADR